MDAYITFASILMYTIGGNLTTDFRGENFLDSFNIRKRVATADLVK